MNTYKSILITGGTGSFGKAFTKLILNNPQYKRVVIYSRDEFKQFEMQNMFPKDKYPQLRFFIGDVRDKERLIRACEGIDVIVHAAALKQVPAAEYNPEEFIKTNINGAQNVIDAALHNNIKNVVALSTDKAAAPINLYGATKLVSDKLFVAANNIKGDRNLKLSVVRYGNVLGSRGSVIPFFLEKSKTGIIPITHSDMTRFNMLLEDAVNMVLWVIDNNMGGEIFVPKLKSFTLTNLARCIAPFAKHDIIGLRPGEKIHEEMITSSDSYYTLDIGNFYAILPSGCDITKYNPLKGTLVQPGFSYTSGNNTQWLSDDEIKKLINDEFNAVLC